MKTTVYVRPINGASPLKVARKGEWIDLKSGSSLQVNAPKTKDGKVEVESYLIPLGVAMRLPPGFEAIVAPRSSTFKNFGVIQANGIGIIDGSFCGTNDEWMFGCVGLRDGRIRVGDRICQFRIQLSQKATLWQKAKWFLSDGIVFKYVDKLESVDRGGFGTSGK